MLRATTLLLTCGLVAGLAQAGDVIVSRPPIAPNSENDGVMAGESDRFGDYRGVYPADSFELTATTTLGHMDVYGSNWTGGSTGFLYTGFTVTIFQDTGFGPEGHCGVSGNCRDPATTVARPWLRAGAPTAQQDDEIREADHFILIEIGGTAACARAPCAEQ